MKTADLLLVGAVVLAGCTTLPDRDGGSGRDDAPSCSCAGLECGDDGCGGTCGTCPAGRTCVAGSCIGCTPSCAGRECGDDGCEGLCGTCPTGQVCSSGLCVCTPSCAGRECGDDGCGGTCGGCGAGEVCAGGLCECASPVTCYRDADGDGFVGDSVTACGGCPSGYAPLGPEEQVDCLDDPTNVDSAAVNPDAFFSTDAYCAGSGAECAAGAAPSSFDWNCDGTITERWGTYEESGTGLCRCGSHGNGYYDLPSGYVSTPPACGEVGSWHTCCRPERPETQQCR